MAATVVAEGVGAIGEGVQELFSNEKGSVKTMDELTEKECIVDKIFQKISQAERIDGNVYWVDMELALDRFDECLVNQAIGELINKKYISKNGMGDCYLPGIYFKNWESEMTKTNAPQSVTNNFGKVNTVQIGDGNINITNADAEAIVKLITSLIAEKKDPSLFSKVRSAIETAGKTTGIIEALVKLGRFLI